MLEVVNLHGYRGLSYVLQGVTLEVADGKCSTVLGRNGMGKTTLMRALMGMGRVTEGDVRMDGRTLLGRSTHEVARLGLGYVPQGRHVFPSLSVEENLRLGQRRDGGAAPGGAWSLERVYELFPNLLTRRANSAGQLSGGEQQMLAIGRALLTNPKVILMDEPSEGLAPVIVQRIADVLLQLKGDGFSILLVEQNYRFGLDVADRVYVVANGRTVWDGAPEELERSASVKEAHLGV